MDITAIIDLGSNTFHLLIVELDHKRNRFNTLFKSREYVKLASEGKSYIDSEAWMRAMQCLKNFCDQIEKNKATRVIAIGTAMLRKASNAAEFILAVKQSYAISIQVIDGVQEAQYIFQGVRYAVPDKFINNSIIIDIGGGSVECIVVVNGKPIQIESFPIGIAILKNQYHHSEPIQPDEIRLLENHLESTLGSLVSLLESYHIDTLIGCSGTFEVLFENFGEYSSQYSALDIMNSLRFIQEITSLNYQERLEHPAVPNSRADLIVVALLLIKWFLEKSAIQHLIYSPYALKEGLIEDFLVEKT